MPEVAAPPETDVVDTPDASDSPDVPESQDTATDADTTNTTDTTSDTADATADTTPATDTSAAGEPQLTPEQQQEAAKAAEDQQKQDIINEFVADGLLDPNDEYFEVQKEELARLTPEELRGVLLINKLENDPELKEAILSGDMDTILDTLAKKDQEVHGDELSPEESRQKAKTTMEKLRDFVAMNGMAALGWLGERTAETWNTGFLELIDAFLQGADYGRTGAGDYSSAGSGAESGEKAVGKDLFIAQIQNNPAKFAEGVLAAYDESDGLQTDWNLTQENRQLLKTAVETGDKQQAMLLLRAVLVGASTTEDTTQKVVVENNMLQYLFAEDDETKKAQRWKKVSEKVGQRIFNKPLRDEVRTLLDDIRKNPSQADTIFKTN